MRGTIFGEDKAVPFLPYLLKFDVCYDIFIETDTTQLRHTIESLFFFRRRRLSTWLR